MLRMLGRLVWVAVGAVGLKAWEESQRQKQSGQSQRGGGSRRGGKRSGGGNGGGSSD
jgi:hypothetical protein